MCSKCLADLPLNTEMLLKICGRESKRWEKVGRERESERARATKKDKRDKQRHKQRKESLCSSTSVDSLLRPGPVMTTRSGCQSDSDKPLKDPLSVDLRKRGGFHGACLNWPCAPNVNTFQTLSLSLCCLQGYWQTHGQIRDRVCLSTAYEQDLPCTLSRCLQPSVLRWGRTGMSLCNTRQSLSLYVHTGRNLPESLTCDERLESVKTAVNSQQIEGHMTEQICVVMLRSKGKTWN